MTDLPVLTEKENKCLLNYFANGRKKTQAYRDSYDCSNMSDNSIYVEASRFFSNPKISLWLDYYHNNIAENIKDKLNYDELKHFEELDTMKEIALSCKDKEKNPNVSVALKAVELKGKLAGLYSDKDDNTDSNNFTLMGTIQLDGHKRQYEVGEPVNDTTS